MCQGYNSIKKIRTFVLIFAFFAGGCSFLFMYPLLGIFSYYGFGTVEDFVLVGIWLLGFVIAGILGRVGLRMKKNSEPPE